MAASQFNAALLRVDHPGDSQPDMDEALRRVRGSDPARLRPGVPRKPRPRLDAVSEAWLAGYRDLALVRPNVSGRVLGAEVEAYLTGTCEDRPELPVRPVRRDHEGRRPQPQPARPHPTGVAA